VVIEIEPLTQEQQLLGELYVWIHRRAEYLRAQRAKTKAEAGRVSEAHPDPAKSQALQPKQLDSITPPHNHQNHEGHDGI